jgi:peptide chain release factor 1
MDTRLSDRLEEIRKAYEDVEVKLADPDSLSDRDAYADLARRHSELRRIIEQYDAYLAASAEAGDADELAAEETDPNTAQQFRQLAAERRSDMERLEEKLHLALVPTDPNDEKDVIVEIRSAAGGDEAALWAGDLQQMYQAFAEGHGFKVETLEVSPSEGGGFKEAIFSVKGQGAYSKLKYEAGVHRVQRVPQTESQGRVHTSTATVAVLPEAEEIEVEIDPADVRVDVYRSTGPGGQSVNTTDSAVRLTHVPTGLVVSCQDEKSQLQNKDKAFRILRARLYQLQLEAQHSEIAGARRAQVGTGGRSEKIRTYNFKENRVTDHRIGLTIKRLPQILQGDLEEFVDALAADEQARRLAEGD